tara:strand:+ start:41 stop:1465 length:1425 start_codon:yes stop_codon:yes gene_type:complete
METREETEARETKLVDDTKTFLQGLVRKVTGINITNPIAGLDVLPTTEESLDPDSLKVYQDVNKPVEQLQSIAKEGLQTATGIYGAALGAYGTVANQPRNIINITPPNQQTNLPSPIQTAQSRLKLNADQVTILNNLQMKLDPSGIDRTPEVPQQIRLALSQIGSRDGVYDHASHLIYKKGKVISSKESRNIIALFETDPMQYIRGKGGKILDFDSYSKTQTKKFWDVYGPELEKRGIKRKSIQLHHITSLQASIGLFDGIQWGSKEWYDLTSHLAKNFIATGNNPKNLMRITGDALTDKGTPHYLTHKFLDKKVGKQGELFFTSTKVEAMKANWATRLQMANEFSSIVKESEAIAVQTQKAWDLIYGIGEVPPEELVEFMSELPANKDYQLPELRKLAVEAIIDMKLVPKSKKVKLPTQAAILKFIKDGKIRQTSVFDKNPSDLNRIMSESNIPNLPKRKYKKKKPNPDQTEL